MVSYNDVKHGYLYEQKVKARKEYKKAKFISDWHILSIFTYAFAIFIDVTIAMGCIAYYDKYGSITNAIYLIDTLMIVAAAILVSDHLQEMAKNDTDSKEMKLLIAKDRLSKQKDIAWRNEHNED